MSHYCVALFHDKDSDPEVIMYPYSYEDESYQVFSEEYSKEEAEKMFKKHNKKAKPDDRYKKIDDFMGDIHGCYDFKDEWYGTKSNPNGLYDWFELGGRWRNILFPKVTKVEMKKRQDDDLKDKTKFDLKEYMRLKMMSPKEYFIENQYFGQTTIMVRDLDIKVTKAMASARYKEKSLNVSHLFYELICEQDGIRDSDESTFEELLESWKDGCITIVDYHN